MRIKNVFLDLSLDLQPALRYADFLNTAWWSSTALSVRSHGRSSRSMIAAGRKSKWPAISSTNSLLVSLLVQKLSAKMDTGRATPP